MHSINTLLITVIGASQNVFGALDERRKHANRIADDRGSLTLEQIIWTVLIAVAAIAIGAIVVAAINNKAAELPL
jgi:hypothetical protein